MNNQEESAKPEFIYHLTLRSIFISSIQKNSYTPSGFLETGFIHCTEGEDLTVLVANEFFSKAKELLVLKLNFKKIIPKVQFEGESSDSRKGLYDNLEKISFPHIYGSLNMDAIEGIGILPKINYIFHFPRKFHTLTEFKEGSL